MTKKTMMIVAAMAATACLLSACTSSAKSTPATTPGSSSPSQTQPDTSSSPQTQPGTSSPSVPVPAVSFNRVSVAAAKDMTSKPKVSARSAQAPAGLEVKDVVVGSGPAASRSSTVTVQYVGVRYTDGAQFDASWDRLGATTFPLDQVVPGFAEGIGGMAGIAPMKVGGRRIMILPAALAYGAKGTSDGSIPPNTPIVFIVDLLGLR